MTEAKLVKPAYMTTWFDRKVKDSFYFDTYGDVMGEMNRGDRAGRHVSGIKDD